MKTLVIGDLHFDNKPHGLLHAQQESIKFLIAEHSDVDDVIFLGDLMMHRKPYPRVLLALKEVIDFAVDQGKRVTIIRGNHDSENKSDDGVTALSLLEGKSVDVVTHTWYDYKTKRAFIPHYEDESKIKEALVNTPKGYTVFGHFGYCGSLNSAGDADFSLSLDDFNNPTFLGHIHRFGSSGFVTLLGTPYSTNFTEHLKENYYAILEDGEVTLKSVDWGPRHIVINCDTIEENLEWINDDSYFTLLRIMVNTIHEDQSSLSDLTDKLKVGYTEIKYKPLLDDKLPMSSLDPDNPVMEISEHLIEEYINASPTMLGKDKLYEGLQFIYENQQGRD